MLKPNLVYSSSREKKVPSRIVGFHKKRGGTLCGGRELEGRYIKVPTNTAVDGGASRWGK